MNCSENVSIGMSPFKALYGRDPPNIFATPAMPSRNAAVSENLGERTALLGKLKSDLAEAQRRMIISANKHRRTLNFRWVTKFGCVCNHIDKYLWGNLFRQS